MIDDQHILRELRAGKNDKVLLELYRHLPGIRRMIRYHGGSRQQAEDIFQESLLILCRKAKDESFVLTSGIYAYLYSVCRFLWNDEQKKSKRLPEVDLNILPDEALDVDAARTVEEERRYRLAEKIITELGDRCRELLLLFYNGRLRLKDIAVKMGYSSEQTAKNQKYKCLETARNRYQQQAVTQH